MIMYTVYEEHDAFIEHRVRNCINVGILCEAFPSKMVLQHELKRVD